LGPETQIGTPQWLKPLGRQNSPLNSDHELLFAVDLGRRISLDTASEVSIGQIDILKNVRLAENPVFVEGIGGTQHFCLEGDLLLAGGLLLTVFAGKKGNLPPDFHALLGTKHVQDLGVSLDYALDNPGCSLQQAMAVRRSYALLSVSSLPSKGEEITSSDLKESSFFFTLFLGLLFLWVVAANWDFRSSSSMSLLWIEPQALLASLVLLALTRTVFEVLSSLSERFSRWKAVSSTQPPSTRPIGFSPSLSALQHENLQETNARFAHLFEDRNSAPNHLTHPIQRSPSSRAPNSKPSFSGLRRTNFRDQPCPFKPSFSGLRRANSRDLPRPPWKKLAARTRSKGTRHPPARRPPH
jgi:hypothetical protein